LLEALRRDAEHGESLTEQVRVAFAVLLEGVAVEGAATRWLTSGWGRS
jgi:hypothetical protein